MTTDQGELFPYARPETVLAFIRRLESMVLTIAPEMTPQQCLRLLGDLSLTTAIAERVSLDIRQNRDWQERQQLPPVEVPTITDESDRLAEQRHWRAAHPPTSYARTQTPAWPDLGFVRRARPRRGT